MGLTEKSAPAMFSLQMYYLEEFKEKRTFDSKFPDPIDIHLGKNILSQKDILIRF